MRVNFNGTPWQRLLPATSGGVYTKSKPGVWVDMSEIRVITCDHAPLNVAQELDNIAARLATIFAII